MVLKIIFMVITLLYAGLMLLAAVLQFKNKSVSVGSPVLMAVGSLLLLISAYQMYYNSPFTIIFLMAGLLLIHISAIINGLQMHGKLTYKHHLIRFGLSFVLVIIALF